MGCRASGRERAAAALAAAAALWFSSAGAAVADGNTRAVTSHVLVGMSPQTSFSVILNGAPSSAVSVESDELGILAFTVDDDGLPGGGIVVTVLASGAPVISHLEVLDVTPTSATIAWTTDAPATSQVEYGPSPDLGNLTPLDGDLVTSHAVALEGLTPGTPYRVRARSSSAEGVPAIPVETLFETLPLAQTGPPIIWGVSARTVSSFYVTVIWDTDRPATSKVRYGIRGVLDLETPVDTTLVVNHRVLVGPVVPEAEYAFVAMSACGADTAACAPGFFRTPGFDVVLAPELKAPTITRARADTVQDTRAVLRWATDRPCSTWVELAGNPEPVGVWPGMPAGGSSYQVEVSGLAPNTVYHYRVCAVDEACAFAATAADSFTTAPTRRDSAPGTPHAVLPGEGDDATMVSSLNGGVVATLSLAVWPNPAVQDAALAFLLPEAGHARVAVYTVGGRLVRVIADDVFSAGPHSATWDLTTGDGVPASSGAYVCAVESGGAVAKRKIVALR